MSPLLRRRDLLDIAEAFRLAARVKTDAEWDVLEARFPPDSDAAGYLQRLQQLPPTPSAPVSLRGLRFAPFFLSQGLDFARRQPDVSRRFVLEVLATGLTASQEHFLALEATRARAGSPSPEQVAALMPAQKRFLAYCLAQLTEAGMAPPEVFALMKLDTLDMESSVELHGWQRRGRDAVLASPLLTPAERALWRAVYDEEPGAWTRLRQHLVDIYQLPFRPAPTPRTP